MIDKPDEFVDGTDFAKDLNITAVSSQGLCAGEDEITILSEISNMSQVTEFINEKLEILQLERKLVLKLDMVVDEILNNILCYGYPDEPGDVTVRVAISSENTKVTMTFIDKGVPYDPLSHEEPVIIHDKDKKKPGGLGLFMVKKTMDEMEYEYKDGCNILIVCKNLDRSIGDGN